jgi:hypothetical protein
MRRPRHRPGTVDRLDPEIKRLISDLRIEKGWNIDEIRTKLTELGAEVSRSALARHTRSLDEIARELRQAREMAKVLASTAEPGEDDALARLNLEMLHTGIFQLQSAIREGKPMEAGQLMALAVAIEKAVAALGKIQQIRERAEKLAAEKLMKTVEGMAKTAGSGLTREAVAAIRHAVLGTD